ncbi:unnamed protein product [Phytomonas sp. EM1]|nr:unnamed protein product [Phytomonas sp. EM1]|eukprot:CCW61181.1 unnamed protein product [Phytomonas sp. isolate EM1]
MPRKLQPIKSQETNVVGKSTRLKEPSLVATKKRSSKAHSSSTSPALWKVRPPLVPKKVSTKVLKLSDSSQTSAEALLNVDQDLKHGRELPRAAKASSTISHNEPNSCRDSKRWSDDLPLSVRGMAQNFPGLQPSLTPGEVEEQKEVERALRGQEARLLNPQDSATMPLPTGPLKAEGKNSKRRSIPQKGTAAASGGGFTTSHTTSSSSDHSIPCEVISGVVASGAARRDCRLEGSELNGSRLLEALPKWLVEEIIKAGERAKFTSAERVPREPGSLWLEHVLRQAIRVIAELLLELRDRNTAAAFSTAASAPVVVDDAVGRSPLREFCLWLSGQMGVGMGLPSRFSSMSLTPPHREMSTSGEERGIQMAFEGHKRGRSEGNGDGNALGDSLLSVLSRARVDFGGLIPGSGYSPLSKHESCLHMMEELEGGSVGVTQRGKSNNHPVVDVPSGVSSSTYEDDTIKSNFSPEKLPEKRKSQKSTKKGKHSASNDIPNRDTARLNGSANSALPGVPFSTGLEIRGDEPGIPRTALGFLSVSWNGSIGVDTLFESDAICRGGGHDRVLEMPACCAQVMAKTLLGEWEAAGTRQEDPKLPLGPTDLVAEGEVGQPKPVGLSDTRSQELPQGASGMACLCDIPESNLSGPPPHSRLLPQREVQGESGAVLGSAGATPTPTLSLFTAHRIRPLCTFPIRALDGFTALDANSFLAHTRAAGKHISFREHQRTKATPKGLTLSPLGCLASQTQDRATVREDMVKGLLLTLSSDQLFGDTLYTGVSVLQEVLREQRQYVGGIGPQGQDSGGGAAPFFGEDDGFGKSLLAFPREVPQGLLPVSGVALQRAHRRINAVRGGFSMGDPDAASMGSKPARYATLCGGIPLAPSIDIEHTYQCRSSFIPQLAPPAVDGDAPGESDGSHLIRVDGRDDAEKGGVAVGASRTLTVERRCRTTSSSSLPLIAFNPDGDLHQPSYRRLYSPNIKDGVGSEGVDAVVTEVNRSDKAIPASKVKTERRTQRVSDGCVEAKQEFSPTFAVPCKSTGEPWPNQRSPSVPMDIDSVLRRGEDCIKRIPMPDVEWRYGPFG